MSPIVISLQNMSVLKTFDRGRSIKSNSLPKTHALKVSKTMLKILSLRKLLIILDLPLIITGKLFKNTNILFYIYMVIFVTTLGTQIVDFDQDTFASMTSILMSVSDFICLSLTELCQLADRFMIQKVQRSYVQILSHQKNTKSIKFITIILIFFTVLVVILLTYIYWITYQYKLGLSPCLKVLLLGIRTFWFFFSPIKFYLLFSLNNNKLHGLVKSLSYHSVLYYKKLIYNCFNSYDQVFSVFQHMKLLNITLMYICVPLTYFAMRSNYFWEYLTWNVLMIIMLGVWDHLLMRANTLVNEIILFIN